MADNETVRCFLTNLFEHHATIEVPDGKAIQIPIAYLRSHTHGGYTLLPGATIEHVFKHSTGVRQMVVRAPKELIDRIPA